MLGLEHVVESSALCHDVGDVEPIYGVPLPDLLVSVQLKYNIM